MRAGLLALALLAAAAPARAGSMAEAEAATSSRRDHTVPGVRDLPVRCRPGDIEYFAGRSMSEVFGADWPAHPAAARVATPPRITRDVVPQLRGDVAPDGATTVTAVLVGADGRPIAARVVCATAAALSTATARAAMRSEYTPATFDGVPAPSVTMLVRVHGRSDR